MSTYQLVNLLHFNFLLAEERDLAQWITLYSSEQQCDDMSVTFAIRPVLLDHILHAHKKAG